MEENPFPSHKGFIRDMTDAQLVDELKHWRWEIDQAKGWGAAVGAANSFRKATEREMEKRGLIL